MYGMSSKEALLSVGGAFVATLLASFLSYTILEEEHIPMILASTGASAMLIFALPYSPVSQPWNLIGGHQVSAFVGISCLLLFDNPLFSSSLAIAGSMMLMHLLRCMHPPGGATAVTAALGGLQIENLEYAFMVIPVFLNGIILLSIAMAVGSMREKNPYE
ncbi:MAG: HPP family protein [Thiotrichales bacterium]|nr:HPP family protein [Thiotrichales bacterium]MBT3613880.1 HPP family protein [Thiotrichales bacterium]MBT3752956.1 HPP family protein [Thiotrichales bacterium]MBT3838174.1 HPP family protein [Thiotrichales bacterium]MBT4151812.1 HPP family protein [Thiotrichales bacterium]